MVGNRVLALAAIGLVFAGRANAQPFQGFYAGGAAGFNFSEDIDSRLPGPPGPGATIRTNGGFLGAATAGYGFGNGFRVELEGNYRRGGIVGLLPAAPSPATGQLVTYAALVNVLYDLDVGSPWLYPYIGAGAGYARTSADGVSLPVPGGQARLTGTQARPAVQAIAGASFPIAGVPGLSATAEYRFMGVIGNETFAAASFPGGPTGIVFRDQFNHGFLVGMRYAFGVTPPPGYDAPVPAAAVPARSFIVFFDWDKAILSDRGRGIVKDAAGAAASGQGTKIEVSGNTDASGTRRYNQGLSLRRAETVAAELVKNGVAKTAIDIQANGETKPLVPTAPGAREPQNRRVEIVLK